MLNSIKLIIFFMWSSVVADAMSSLFDAHWLIAGFSLTDYAFIGLTTFSILITYFITKYVLKAHGESTKIIGIFTIISVIALGSEISNMETIFPILLSFQGLETILWISAYGMCKTQSVKNYFIGVRTQ